MLTIKSCTKCKEIKNISEFKKETRNKNGFSYWCTDCQVSYSHEYYLKNRKKALAERAIYRDENKDKIAKDKREVYINNREDILEDRKKYYINNKDKVKKRDMEYRRNNKDAISKRSKEYRQTELYSRYRDELKKTDKYKIGQINSRDKRRYMKKNQGDGTLSVRSLKTKALIDLLHLQQYKCNNCRCDISENKHLDHHVPLSKGGIHSIDNVVWLCPSCNMLKSDKMPASSLLIVI